jgi:hypothetical protein
LATWLTSDDAAKRAKALAYFKVDDRRERPHNVELSFLQLDTDPEYEAVISLRAFGAALIMDRRGTSWFGAVIDVGEPGLWGDLRLSSKSLTGEKYEELLAVTEGHWENGTFLALRIFSLRPDGLYQAHHAVLYDIAWNDLTGAEAEQLGQVEARRHLGALVLLDRFGKKQCEAFAWNPAIIRFVPNADATRALCRP